MLELLIVVAVIGIIAAVAIPNLINAIHRARQSRTAGDIRTIGEAVDMYQRDYGFFPEASDGSEAKMLIPYLLPYIGNYNPVDGWRRPFRYTSNGRYYTLVSYGGNGLQDEPYVAGPTVTYSADVVFSDGIFVQWPQGLQAE